MFRPTNKHISRQQTTSVQFVLALIIRLTTKNLVRLTEEQVSRCPTSARVRVIMPFSITSRTVRVAKIKRYRLVIRGKVLIKR